MQSMQINKGNGIPLFLFMTMNENLRAVFFFPTGKPIKEELKGGSNYTRGQLREKVSRQKDSS